MKSAERKNANTQHVLVCLSSAPSNEKIIRTAADMAIAYGAKFSAIFVETADFQDASQENKARLNANIELAKQLGAHIETVVGEDIALHIAKYGEMNGVTKIVLGKSTFTKKKLFGKSNLDERLLAYAPDVDIHIIPDKSADNRYIPSKSKRTIAFEAIKDSILSLGVLGGATALGFLFHHLGFADANLMMAYILGVLIISITTSHIIFSLASSVASVFLFNYLFTNPRFSLTAYDTGYPITFIVMFITAFITGTLAQRYKTHAKQSASVASRLRHLFDTNRQLSSADTKADILDVTASQIIKMLDCNALVFDDEYNQSIFLSKNTQPPVYDIEIERKNAECVMNGKKLQYKEACVFKYYPLKVNDRVYGAVGVDKKFLTAVENDSLLTICIESALALENKKNDFEKEQAAIAIKTEQLRANILRSLSHDLRTPLTSISGNACNLIENENKFDEDTKLQIYKDIFDDSQWLISLVENILASTRIEDEKPQLKLSNELAEDLVDAAVTYSLKKANGHTITVRSTDDMLFVNVDAKLMVQVLINIIDNAIKYTPAGSRIDVETKRVNDMAVIIVKDDGKGIPDRDKPHIFDKFFSGSQGVADSRRSLGLGLYLCKAIVDAHGGNIHVCDNTPSGTIMTIELPIKEILLNEQTSNIDS